MNEVQLKGDGHTIIAETSSSCRESMSATSVGVNQVAASTCQSKDKGGQVLISSCNKEERQHIHKKANEINSLSVKNAELYGPQPEGTKRIT